MLVIVSLVTINTKQRHLSSHTSAFPRLVVVSSVFMVCGPFSLFTLCPTRKPAKPVTGSVYFILFYFVFLQYFLIFCLFSSILALLSLISRRLSLLSLGSVIYFPGCCDSYFLPAQAGPGRCSTSLCLPPGLILHAQLLLLLLRILSLPIIPLVVFTSSTDHFLFLLPLSLPLLCFSSSSSSFCSPLQVDASRCALSRQALLLRLAVEELSS